MWLPHAKATFCFYGRHSKLQAIPLRSVISMKLNIGKSITGLEMMVSMNGMFPNLQNWCLRGSYTVFRDVLESRQVGRMLKLVNPKHKDWGCISSYWLSLNLSASCTEINKQFVHLFLIGQKSLHNWFSLQSPKWW